MPATEKQINASLLVEIFLARRRLKNLVLRTPLIHSPALSKKTDCEIYLKMECWQLTGSFKVRGAINMVSALSKEEKDRGLVTTSSGNHGTALAYAASILGHPPTRVYLPKYANRKKVEKIRSFGAEAVLFGENFFESLDEAQRYVKETNATYVHSASHLHIIAGQGTIGLEVTEDLPDVDAVIVPIGGGGLISGISKAVRTINDRIRVIGVEPMAAQGAFLSLRDDRCYERVENRQSVADGLLGALTPLTFEISRNLVERVALLEEDEIIDAMRVFQAEEQLMLEGSAVVGLAAILAKKVDVKGQKVVLIVTGRNIDAERYNKLINARQDFT